jgi:ResB-like family
MSFSANLKKIGFRLARPDILFWVLPFMILVLVIGTVSQKELGILVAQQRYFSSFFYMLWFIPLPGGMTLLTILFMNLLAKFLFKSKWSWAQAGTIITHFGVLVLILGGAFTYFTAREGFLIVGQEETSNTIEDYHERIMAVRQNDKIIYQIPFDDLMMGQTLPTSSIPFLITINKTCYNCGITRRPVSDQDGWTSPGKFMQLNQKPSDPQDEKNMTGIEFSVSGAGDNENGKYLTFDKFPKPPQIKDYTISIERQKRDLPFSVTLDSFKQEFHAGTDMAKAYRSTIKVTDNNTSWPAIIQMNDPLRYKGYTLYQSSFDMTGDKPYTVLTVVENKGRIFPYISTIIIAAGLLLHLIIRISKKKGAQHV